MPRIDPQHRDVEADQKADNAIVKPDSVMCELTDDETDAVSGGITVNMTDVTVNLTD